MWKVERCAFCKYASAAVDLFAESAYDIVVKRAKAHKQVVLRSVFFILLLRKLFILNYLKLYCIIYWRTVIIICYTQFKLANFFNDLITKQYDFLLCSAKWDTVPRAQPERNMWIAQHIRFISRHFISWCSLYMCSKIIYNKILYVGIFRN